MKVVKAKHSKDWSEKTTLFDDNMRPGGKNGHPDKHPQEYSILNDKYAQFYVYKLLNQKGKST